MSRLTAQGRGARSEILEAPKRHEGRAIADAAATMGAGLIVMGSKRHGQCHHHAPNLVLVAS